VYDNACDATCNVCSATRTPDAHVYDNACDATCNVCSATRTIEHAHGANLTADDTTHYYLCSVCGDKKDEVAHTFDKSIASSEFLKSGATGSTKAQYYKSCVCGKASATEYFEVDKVQAFITDVQDLSKTYDRVEVANPTFTTNSNGVATFEWYYASGEKMEGKPMEAGTYKVVITIPETATHTGFTTEKSFVIRQKVISNISVEFEYVGIENLYYTLTVEDGIFEEDIDLWFFVEVEFTSSNVGANVCRTAIVTDEHGVGDESYVLDMSTFSAIIVPRVIWAENVEFIYNGKDCFDHEDLVGEVTYSRLLDGDISLAEDIIWTFESKDTGAKLKSVEFATAENNTNYAIDFSKCSASITPRTLNYLNITKTYDGKAGFGRNCPSQYKLVAQDGVIGDDEVFLETFGDVDYNAGKYYLSGKNSTMYMDGALLYGDDAQNYVVFGHPISANNFATIIVNPIDLVGDYYCLERPYDGTVDFAMTIPGDEYNSILEGESSRIYAKFNDSTVDGATTFTALAVYDAETGLASKNYIISDLGTFLDNCDVGISTKSLKDFAITVVYDEDLCTKYITLCENDGVLDGDEVILMTEGQIDYYVGVYSIATEYRYGSNPGKFDDYVTLKGEDASNYSLGTDAEGLGTIEV
ncbi:MAG: hypothetical protein J6U74_01080, partial [Clostridia bacterium]|nr:hypothetical protein [Clostridia bacterium]